LKTYRRLPVAMIAACLTIGLVAAPSASAAGAKAKSSAAQKASSKKKARAAQSNKTLNRRLNATRKSLSSTRKSLSTTRRQLTTARRTLSNLSRDLGALSNRMGSAEGGLSLLLGAAPQLVNGLQTLADAVQNQIAPNLQKLGDAVQNQIAPNLQALGDAVQNQIAPGLEKVGKFIGATEYGFGQVILLTPDPEPELGAFVVTPDIPDTVQQAQTSQAFEASQAGQVAVLYGVRSGEKDGTGPSDPAAHCKVTVTNNSTGETATTAPNADLGGLPFQPVPEKSALTSTEAANQTFPFGLKQAGDDADKTTTFASGITVSDGDPYTVGLSCVDLSADADDPEA